MNLIQALSENSNFRAHFMDKEKHHQKRTLNLSNFRKHASKYANALKQFITLEIRMSS